MHQDILRQIVSVCDGNTTLKLLCSSSLILKHVSKMDLVRSHVKRMTGLSRAPPDQIPYGLILRLLKALRVHPTQACDALVQTLIGHEVVIGIPFVKALVGPAAYSSATSICLMRASVDGNLDAVRFLVEQGADVTVRHNFCSEIADMLGYQDIVRYLETCKYFT